MAAVTDFDKYDRVAVEHDQVEFTAAAQPVLCQQAQAMAFQVSTRLCFGGAPIFLALTD